MISAWTVLRGLKMTSSDFDIQLTKETNVNAAQPLEIHLVVMFAVTQADIQISATACTQIEYYCCYDDLLDGLLHLKVTCVLFSQ